MLIRFIALCAVGVFSVVGVARADDWPQFRGRNSSGVADTASVPVEFGPGKNELWQVDVGAGHSSPCIVGDTIFLTTLDAAQKRLSVVCLDRLSGDTRWKKSVFVKRLEKGHPSFNPASSSPASDGQRVVAYFGSYGLICYDTSGEKLWDVEMPMTKSFGGNATSPVIIDDRVILYRGNYVDHFLVAVDKHSGKELWRVEQDEEFTGEMGCTSCPIVAGDKLIVHSARSVQAFDVQTGKQIWATKCATTATSTPILAGDEVIVAAWNKLGEASLRPPMPTFEQLIGKHDKNADQSISRDEFPKLWIFHRPDGAEAPLNGGTVRFERTDINKDGSIDEKEWSNQLKRVEDFRARYSSHGLLAIQIDSEGAVSSDKIRTLATRSIPEVPSPVCDGTYIYLVKNGGVLTCLEVKTGKRVYQIRTGGRGTHYASPLIADGKLLTVAGDGRISVVKLGSDHKVLAKNEMNENVYATPAIVDGTIYVRTHSKLFAFRQSVTPTKPKTAKMKPSKAKPSNRFEWHRFEVDGRPAFMILPDKPAQPIPWVMYAPTFNMNLPKESQEGWMIEKFLEKGIAIAGVDVGESYGSPKGRTTYNGLYKRLTEGEYKFAPKASLLARSRGGLMLYNWAAENPQKVAAIAGIYPVCDLRSYPGLAKACGAYDLTENELQNVLAKHNPIDRLTGLAKARVPIFHIHGNVDKVVPFEANTGTISTRYKQLGGKMTVVVAPNQGHNMWDGFFYCQELVDFVVTHSRSQRTR